VGCVGGFCDSVGYGFGGAFVEHGGNDVFGMEFFLECGGLAPLWPCSGLRRRAINEAFWLAKEFLLVPAGGARPPHSKELKLWLAVRSLMYDSS